MSVRILGCAIGRMWWGAGLSGCTGDKNVLLDGCWEHAKESIIDMLADDIDTARCACDVSGWVSEAGGEGLCKGIPADAASAQLVSVQMTTMWGTTADGENTTSDGEDAMPMGFRGDEWGWG